MSLAELKPHLHIPAAQPTAIPYVTSYYHGDREFCIRYQVYECLAEGDYDVVVDSTLADGFVEIGEAVLPGDLGDEVLLSAYICQVSIASNELSGPPLVVAFLYARLRARAARRYTHRFVLNVETIGTICHLHLARARPTSALTRARAASRTSRARTRCCTPMTR